MEATLNLIGLDRFEEIQIEEIGSNNEVQFELMPMPPEQENRPLTWPEWPIKLRTSSSHEEGCSRDWSVTTKRFEGEAGKVTKLIAARLEWEKGDDGRMQMREMPNSEFELKADLVLFAMGFVNPVHEGLLSSLGVKLDNRGNVDASTEDYKTSHDKVFVAGDMRRGQSLVVWAIREGRQCARSIDEVSWADRNFRDKRSFCNFNQFLGGGAKWPSFKMMFFYGRYFDNQLPTRLSG